MRSTKTEARRPRLRSAVIPSLVLLALTACGGDDLLLPSLGQPARITVISGTGQNGTVGQALLLPFVVEVTDPQGRAVEGVEVAFVPPPGGALKPKDTVLTGPDGRATVNYILAPSSGQQTIEARARPVVPSPSLTTSFTAVADPEAATRLVLDDGNGQEGEVQTALAESLAVKAVDRFGNGVAGVEVTWHANEGSLSPEAMVTGSDGRAATQRTLGARPGVYRTSANAGDLEGSPVEFESQAITPPSPQLVLVTQPSSAVAAGVPFERQPVLQLQDALGAPLARGDVAVTVQISEGEVSLGGSTTARSNAEGRVSFTNLSIRGRTGERTLLFAAVDFTPVLSETIVVTPGPPSAGQSAASVPNGTAGTPTAISIQVKDEFGNPVDGATGAIGVAVEGVNPTASLVVAEQGGGSYSASYTPVRSGTDLLLVQLNGAPVTGSPYTSVVAAGPPDPATTTAEFVRNGIFNTTLNTLVTTRDAQGNAVGHGGDHVQVQYAGEEVRDAVDQGDGTYADSFFAGFSSVSVTILLNGVPIAGSPFQR